MKLPTPQKIILIVIFFLAAIVIVQNKRQNTKTVCRHCNVIVIVIDALRADQLPCYGYAKQTAPSLCRFAAENIRFTDAFANASWTLPGTMSLFTSLYAKNHGLDVTMEDVLNPHVRTMPQVFAHHRYDTVFVSNANLNLVSGQGFGKGFSSVRYIDTDLPSTEGVDEWRATINRIKKKNEEGDPVYAFFHTDAVHDYLNLLLSPNVSFPLDPTYRLPDLPAIGSFTEDTWSHLKERLIEIVDNEKNPPEIIAKYQPIYDNVTKATTYKEAEREFRLLPIPAQQIISLETILQSLSVNDPRAYAQMSLRLYDESIRRTDEALNALLLDIEHAGLMDNSIIVITADHGELLGEHDIVGHGSTMYYPEIHIPLIIRMPGVSSRTITALTQYIDLFPTLTDLTGIRTTNMQFDGKSLYALLQGDPNAKEHAFIISEWINDRSIITKQWHLIETIKPQGTFRELYNRKTDPSETDSVASTSNDIVEQLSTLLRETLRSRPAYTPTTKPLLNSLSKHYKDLLIRAGYLL